MNWRAIFAIVRKDLKLVLQNKGVIIPIIAVPVIIFGALPWISAFVPSTASLGNNSLDRLTALIAQMPAGLRDQLAPYSMEQQSIFFFLVYLLAPLFLIVPLMVAVGHFEPGNCLCAAVESPDPGMPAKQWAGTRQTSL